MTLWTVAHQAPLSMRFPRQEYWSGLLFPSPGDLPNPGIKPTSLALQASFLLSESPGKSVLVAISSFYVNENIIPFAFVLKRYYFWIHNCNFISILLCTLKISFHCLVASMIAVEKFAVNLIDILYNNLSFFSDYPLKYTPFGFKSFQLHLLFS